MPNRPAEPEAERGFFEQEVAPRGNRGARRDDVGVRVVVVFEDKAREAHRRPARVVELDPVTGDTAVRLDLIDLHRREVRHHAGFERVLLRVELGVRAGSPRVGRRAGVDGARGW